MREKIEKSCDDRLSVLRGTKGFKNTTFVFNTEKSELGGFSVWESKEDFEASRAAYEPKRKEFMSEFANGPAKRFMFEVYEPKT